MIRGDKVYLRVVTEADLALLKTWSNDMDFNSDYNSFGLQPADAIEKRFAEDGLLSSRYGSLLIVTLNDDVIGSISYHQVRYGPNEGSVAFNIGLSIAAEHRGKGYGVEAQKLLASYLLATYPVIRIEASTDKENIAEQRALEKAGFTREGVLRQAQWRSGSWHDLVVYSKLRGE
jgi:aminoglycoside 6'-N-acetyltransferase